MHSVWHALSLRFCRNLFSLLMRCVYAGVLWNPERGASHARDRSRLPYNWFVQVLRNFCAVAVLCLWTSSPLLSCVLSFAQMNTEEMACCKQMAGDCGAMNNSSHSCCKKVAQAGDVLAFDSGSTHPLPDHQLQSPAGLPVLGILFPAEPQVSTIFSPSHSPPLRTGSSLVLRI